MQGTKQRLVNRFGLITAGGALAFALFALATVPFINKPQASSDVLFQNISTGLSNPAVTNAPDFPTTTQHQLANTTATSNGPIKRFFIRIINTIKFAFQTIF